MFNINQSISINQYHSITSRIRYASLGCLVPVRVWNEKDVASFNFSVLPGNVGKSREGHEVHKVLAGSGDTDGDSD